MQDNATARTTQHAIISTHAWLYAPMKMYVLFFTPGGVSVLGPATEGLGTGLTSLSYARAFTESGSERTTAEKNQHPHEPSHPHGC